VADRDCDLLVSNQVFEMDFSGFRLSITVRRGFAVEFLDFFEFTARITARSFFPNSGWIRSAMVLAGDAAIFRDFRRWKACQRCIASFEIRVGPEFR